MMKKKKKKKLCILDANNLIWLGYESKYLPTRWISNGKQKKKRNNINLASYKDNSNKGIILEVDLEYPKELHNLHNDYPVAPEKMKISNNMLSNYCKNLKEKYKISSGQVQKLITSLNNKTNYVLHYRNLQLYLDLGLKLKNSTQEF